MANNFDMPAACPDHVLMNLDTTEKRNQGRANGSVVTRAKVARNGSQWERPAAVWVISLVAAVVFVNALQ